MSEVSGPGSVEVGAFTITSNTTSAEEMSANLKPKIDKAASEAASQLGKRGAVARAEAKAKADEEPEAEEKPAAKPIKPIPPKTAREDDQSPSETGEPEEKPAEEAKAEGEEPEEKKPEEKPPNPRHDPKARMLEATRKEAEAKRALADERRRNDDLQARLDRLERIAQRVGGEEPPAERPQADGRPRLADFVARHDTYEEAVDAYEDARDAYNREQSDKSQREHALRQAYDNAKNAFAAETHTLVDQIDPAIGELRTEWQLRPDEAATGENWLANYLFVNPKQAPALMLHLSAHQDDLQRIASLTNPHAVTREMAILATRLEAASAGSSSRREDDVSRAAPPVRPVTGKPYVSAGEDLEARMGLEEYSKVWKSKTRRR